MTNANADDGWRFNPADNQLGTYFAGTRIGIIRQPLPAPAEAEMIRRFEQTRRAADEFIYGQHQAKWLLGAAMPVPWRQDTGAPSARAYIRARALLDGNQRIWHVGGQVGGIGDGRAVLGKDTR